MQNFSFAGCSYPSLVQAAKRAFGQECTSQAVLLAVLAEVDAHQHYRPAGYSSLYAWCVGELGLRDQRAYKRMSAAGYARRFPAILPMVADGRLCMTAVNQLGPHLTEQNAEALLAAAANRSKFEIELLLAELQQPDLLRPVEATSGRRRGRNYLQR